MVGKFQKKLEKTVPISVISVKIPLFSIVGIEVSMQSSTKLHDGFSESSLRAGKLLFRGRFQNSDGNLHNALTIQRSKVSSSGSAHVPHRVSGQKFLL